MNPSSNSPDSIRHGKRPMIQPFSSSSSEQPSSSSSSPSGGFRLAADAVAAAEEEEEEKTVAAEAAECYVCGRRFGTWKALFGHMRCHPEREWRGVRPLGDGEEGSRGRRRWRRRTGEDAAEPGGAGEYTCGECLRVFSTRQALGGHRASHRGVLGCSAKAKQTMALVVRGRDGSAACQVCGRHFATYHGMRVHQRVHRERHHLAGEGEGRRDDRGFLVDLNLPPPPEADEHR